MMPVANNGRPQSPHPRPTEISLLKISDLLCCQRIYFAAVVFVIRKAFINLRPRQSRKTRHHLIDGSSRLDHRHDVVNTKSRPLDYGVARTHAGLPDNVTVARSNHVPSLSTASALFKLE